MLGTYVYTCIHASYKHTNVGAAHEDDGGYDTSILISDLPLEFDKAHACTKPITRLHYDLLDDELPLDGVAPVVERLLTANSTLYLSLSRSLYLSVCAAALSLSLSLHDSLALFLSLSLGARAFEGISVILSAYAGTLTHGVRTLRSEFVSDIVICVVH
jgi:hypothetical protein